MKNSKSKFKNLAFCITVLIFTFFILHFNCFAADQLTITTYYPSPYGVYKVLRVYPNTDCAVGGACNKGEICYNSTSDQFLMCGSTSLWAAMGGGGGYWTQTGSDLYANDTAWNVGIGTTNPSTKLEVASPGDYTSIRIKNLESTPGVWELRSMQTPTNNNGLTIWGGSQGSENDRLVITPGGNVGIGTNDPGVAKLYVANDGTNVGLYIGNLNPSATWAQLEIDGPVTNHIWVAENGMGVFVVTNGGSGYFDGSVGIGAAPGAYRLNVNGNMFVNGSITGSTGLNYTYPDYVFDPKYKMLTINKLKKFITENKRLPGMPSAKETKEKGVEIFEQNRLVLEKLEEAYLYIIELQDRIEKLENSK